MTEEQISAFRQGYDECRYVILSAMRKIAGQGADVDIRAELEILVVDLECDIELEHWEAIQKEFPGITREEYEAECDASAEQIRKEYYSEHGYLKPRLVK